MAVTAEDVVGRYPEVCAGVDEAVIEAHIVDAVETVTAACLRPVSSADADAVDTAVVHQTAHTLDAGVLFDLHGYEGDVKAGAVTYSKPALLSPRALRVLQTAGLTVPLGG